MKIDLHTHSIYSDGLDNIETLLDNAKRANVSVMALTDHDNVDGVEEAIKKSSNYGIKVIAGIELTTIYKNETVHVVGLFKDDIIPHKIKEYSISMKEIRYQRAMKMLEDIKTIYNVEVNFNILDNLNIITRGNMIQILLESNENMTYDEACFYISKESKAYIRVSKLELSEGLKLLKDSNCLSILAHPVLIDENILPEILTHSFDGIEARYPKNKQGDEEKLTAIAKERNMFISAGSDYHGDLGHADIGTCCLNYNEYEIILKKMEE